MTVVAVINWLAASFSAAVLLLFLVIIYKIFRNQIKLDGLLLETDGGKASLSRFQWLVFLLVIAGLYAVLCVQANAFIEIPGSALGLLGISTGGFLVSKNLSNSAPTTEPQPQPNPGPAPAPAPPPGPIQPI